MDTHTTLKMPGTPKPWMNAAMRIMMGLPGLRRLLGKSFAMISVTGAKTGRSYSTPVQWLKMDNSYVVLSQKHRIWWRNIRTRPRVDLAIGGHTIHGQAHIAKDTEAFHVLAACLTGNPRIAKFYGIQPGESAPVDPADILRLSDMVVPIVINP